jgi:hypothetical protein
MEKVDVLGPPPERPVQWGTGIKAALATGAIFWLVSRGIPWASSGLVSPTVMGREIKHPGELNFGLASLAIGLHLFCAVLYGVVMMPLIHRFVYSNAWLVGAAMGALLYFANMAAFAGFGGYAPYSREMPVFLTHLAFGIVFTGAYKGLVQRRIGIAA